MLRSKLTSENGSSSIEFITAGMILLVPLVYLVLAMSSLQSGTFAVEGAARQAARAFVLADDESSGRSAAQRALAVTLADYGLSEESVSLSMDCSDGAAPCLVPGEVVVVTVRVDVAMPLVPAVLGLDQVAVVPVQASSTERVSKLWGAAQ